MNKTETTNSRMSRARSILPWLVPPVLALVAFFPVTGMWFVADDFGHLLFNNRLPFPRPLLAFGDNALFYRPFSTVLTWNLGTAIFGRDALPYHIVSLLFHALAAFLLARVVYVISGSKLTAILTGSLFAVYPLITEPVAWLASQWDVFGMSCLLGAVLGFALAWRRKLEGKSWRLPYALGLFSAFLAVGMKESTLPLPLVLPFVALAISETKNDEQPETRTPNNRIASFVRSIGWSLPYALPSLLFVTLRLVGSGNIGGYTNAPTDLQHFFWDNMIKSFLAMLMPLNRILFGETVAQVVGLAMTALFFGMLILWGRQKWPMLLLALVWWIVFIVPVLNLLAGDEDRAHIGNRLYYLSLVGFCMALATLISVPLQQQQHRARQVAWIAVITALLVAIPVMWKQLEPWTQASKQTRQVVHELTSMLPPRSDGFIEINAHSLPREYDGAYVFWNGLDTAIQVFHRQRVHLVDAAGLDARALVAPLKSDTARWNLDFAFDPNDELFYVDGLSGMAVQSDPPNTANTRLWDFRTCTEGGAPPAGWQAANAAAECAQTYLDFAPTNNDPTMILPDLDLDLASARWLRIGVAVRYDPSTTPHLAEWYWTGADKQLSEQNSTRYYLSNDAQWQVYWTFVRADRIGPTLGNLRFDPANDKVNAQISWIAITPIGK